MMNEKRQLMAVAAWFEKRTEIVAKELKTDEQDLKEAVLWYLLSSLGKKFVLKVLTEVVFSDDDSDEAKIIHWMVEQYFNS